MQSVEKELQDLENLAMAISKAFEAHITAHSDLKRFLRKIYNRVNYIGFDDESGTRLDPDLMDELKTFLQIQPDDSEETRPD